MKFLLPVILLFSFIGTAQGLTIHVSDDTYISGNKNNDENFGDSEELLVGNNYFTYIRFNTLPFYNKFKPEDIVSVTLRLHIKSITHDGSILVNPNVYQIQQEDEMTWQNRVDYYGRSQQKVALSEDSENDTGSFIFVNLTGQLKYMSGVHNTHTSFVIRSADGLIASFSSKESGGNSPQIEVMLKASDIGALKGKQDLMDGDLQSLEGKITEMEGWVVDLIEEGLSPLKGLEKRIKELEKQHKESSD